MLLPCDCLHSGWPFRKFSCQHAIQWGGGSIVIILFYEEPGGQRSHAVWQRTCSCSGRTGDWPCCLPLQSPCSLFPLHQPTRPRALVQCFSGTQESVFTACTLNMRPLPRTAMCTSKSGSVKANLALGILVLSTWIVQCCNIFPVDWSHMSFKWNPDFGIGLAITRLWSTAITIRKTLYSLNQWNLQALLWLSPTPLPSGKWEYSRLCPRTFLSFLWIVCLFHICRLL